MRCTEYNYEKKLGIMLSMMPSPSMLMSDLGAIRELELGCSVGMIRFHIKGCFGSWRGTEFRERCWRG